MKILKRWHDAPKNAYQVYDPKFREMSIEQIEQAINFELNYKPHGYTACFFNWNVSTVFITK